MANAPQSLADIMAQLEAAYTPSRQIIQQQQAALPGQRATAIQGLDAAKTTGFNQINDNANARGVSFGGVPIQEQSRYLGEKYLPAVAGVESSISQQGTALQQALASLYQDQYTKAIGTQQNQQSAFDAAQEAERQRQFQASEGAKNRSASAAQSSQKQQGLSVQFVKNNRGGLDLINNDGSRNNTLDLAGYIKLNGGGRGDLLNMLSTGDKQDKQAVVNYYNNEKKYGAAKAWEQLRKDRSTAFYKGGNL